MSSPQDLIALLGGMGLLNVSVPLVVPRVSYSENEQAVLKSTNLTSAQISGQLLDLWRFINGIIEVS